MLSSLHGINVSLETYEAIGRQLEQEHQGFVYIPDTNLESPQDSRYYQYYHIENACRQLTESQLHDFVDTLKEPPVCYPKVVGAIMRQPDLNSIYARTAIEHCQGTSDLLLCQKCYKINKSYQSWACPQCKKYFHFECLPKHMRVFYADYQDPHWTIPISDILNGEQSTLPINQEDISNFYESDGHFKIQNEVLIQGAVYCPECFERSCIVCRGMNASLTCQCCQARYHEECTTSYYPGKKFICEQCKIDGGYATVDKIIAIKFLSFKQLEYIAKDQLKEKMHEEYDDSQTLYANFAKYSEGKVIRTPYNIYLSDRFYFLVKLNYQSYWRVKWISHYRIQTIARARLSAINLLNCLTVYYGMKREFGLERVVYMNEINTKLGQQQSDEILKVDFVDSSDSESSAPTNAETEFEVQHDNRFVSNCQLPQGFDNYYHINYDDFILDGVPPKYQAVIKNFLTISPQFVQDAVVNYAMVLHQNGVPPAFLVPNIIISRNCQSYLVRWLGGNFEESTFETIYFLLPYGKSQLTQFLLESMCIKRSSLFPLIGLRPEQKTWIEQDQTKIVKGRLGEYRQLVATPPYLLLDGKNLYDFYLMGINWLLFTHSIRRGVLFCDQMGLGKSIYVCGFIAALTEQGCFGPHLIVCPTSTLNNWVRELRKWIPFLSIGLLEVTDMVGIEITLKTGIKSWMKLLFDGNTKSGGKDAGVNMSYTNSDNDAVCRSGRKYIIEIISELVRNQENRQKWTYQAEKASYLCFSSLQGRDYNGATHYDVVILSYETSTNLFRKRIDTIYYKDYHGKVYSKTYYSYFHALLESMGPFSTLICDEGHRLKGGLRNQVFAVLDHVYCKYRIILTGTPIYNNFEEFTNLLSFIEPNYFNESKCSYLIYLATNASNPIYTPDQRKEAISKLNEMVRPHVLIRSHEDVFQDPVVKAEIFIPVDMTKRQKLIYSKILYDDRFNLTQRRLFKQRASILRNTAVSLRHICNHPVLLDRRYQSIIGKMDVEEFLDMSAKMKMVDRLLRGIHARGRKVLIFSQFVMVLNTLEILLKKRSYNYLRLDGSIHSADRQQLIDKFNDPANNYTVFILSTNSGGMGINLYTAQDVIIFDASWNPQNDLQAYYRAARIGQKEIVRVYKIFCRDTIDQRILERAKQKLSLSYILVKPLSGISKIDDKDNMDDILNYGCQSLLKSFRDMSYEMMRMGELFYNGIDFESDYFKLFMKSVDDYQIEYTDEEIDRLLDMEPVELATEQAKCLRAELGDQHIEAEGTLNKNEFFAAFRIAEFKVGKKEEKDEIITTQAREKKKPAIQPKSTGIVADNTKYWTELFTKTFGEEVLKPPEREEEQAELTEIDTELSVFRPVLPKNAKPKDMYTYNEAEVPVIKFLINPEKSEYEMQTGFVANTVDQLVDVSSKANLSYDMNEAQIRQILHLAHTYFGEEYPPFYDSIIEIVKFAFASPVFACAALNHRELYKLQFDHKTELQIAVDLLLQYIGGPEDALLRNCSTDNSQLLEELALQPDFALIEQNIYYNKSSNTAFLFTAVFQYSRKSKYDPLVIYINEEAFSDASACTVIRLNTFLEYCRASMELGPAGTDFFRVDFISLITPRRFNHNTVHLLHRASVYHYKVYLTQLDNHLQTIGAIDCAFNIVYFRKVCTEILRKFEMSGSDYSAVVRETGVDVLHVAKKMQDQNQGMKIVAPRKLPVVGTTFSLELIQTEITRMAMIVYKQLLAKSHLVSDFSYDKKLRSALLQDAKKEQLELFGKRVAAFVILCSMFGFVGAQHVCLSQYTQKYIHILNYNDELDAEYDLLYPSYAAPKPAICVSTFVYDASNKYWREIMGLAFRFTYVELTLAARKSDVYAQYDYDGVIFVLRNELAQIVEQIGALKRKTNERELAGHAFVKYIKQSVALTIDSADIAYYGRDLCKNVRGYREGFWHPADSFVFGLNYTQRKTLWRFFVRCGFPTDPEVFRLYKSKLGYYGAIAHVISAVGEAAFDEKLSRINYFFRDRILALFEARLAAVVNYDPSLQKCEPYYTLLSKTAPICWKNLPFDMYTSQLSKELLFLLLFQCAISDGCKDFLQTVLFTPGTNEKAVLEALIQLPIIADSDRAAFGLLATETAEALPMFTKNRVIANEKRRRLIYQQYQQHVAFYLPKVAKFLPASILQFMYKTTENDWFSLVSGLVIMGLFRYGLAGFKQYILYDQSINISQVLRNTMQNLRPKSDRFDKANVFAISDAQRLLGSLQVTDLDKCLFMAAILSAFLLATQFAKREVDGADFEAKYWDCVIYEGSKDVWTVMQSVLSRSWGPEFQECMELKRDVELTTTWFSDFRFSGIVSECYPMEK